MDYPDPEDEFELQYGDELQILAEQEDEVQLTVHTAGPSVRKSLNFTTPNSKTKSQLNKSSIDNPQPSTSKQADLLENSFDTDFQQLQVDANNDQNSKKRGVEDLFGDIDDLLLEEATIVTKKAKTEDEKLVDNLALIDRIVELRKLARYHEALNISLTDNYKSVSNIDHIRHNLSYRVPKYPFIGVTRHDGERIYVRMHSEEYEKEDILRVTQNHSFTGIMGTASKDLWNGANEIINKNLDRQNESAEAQQIEVQETDNSKLWVDMYKPRKYTELLSDESTNRSLLKWLKLWDKVVFRRRPKIKPELKTFNSKFPNNNQKFFQKKELDLTLDEHDRPQNKVALLCGPPGLGKTTLAHMVARHAGYNVVEVNASDDRNVDSFKTALENATQMKSVIDREGRPNCLVFDEIDGAPAAAIDYLIKFINGTLVTKSKKGKKQKASILKRPIICICNDVYVPALRPLRQIAFILNFPPTASVRLAERLKEICKHQRLKSDTGAMMALSEKTNNDIRACLSVLHFFKTKNIPVSLSEINKTNIGQKDMQKGLFTVWQEIFEIQRSKRGDDDVPLATRMKNILSTVVTFGDYERLAQGVFENYPLIKHKGSALGPICTAAEWFSYTDCMSRKIHETQNYTMNSYMPYGFVVWHFVFATYMKKKIAYPSVAAEVYSKTIKQNGIIAEILRGIPSHVRSYVSADSLRLDILPMFNEILVPNLRTINVSLYAPHEKIQINHVVDIMIDYNLTYVQERNVEGNYLFYIDPNIDEVTMFQGLKVQRKTLSYTSKQMLSREIEMEKMKRLEKGTNFRVTEEVQTPSVVVAAAKEKKKENIENVVPNHLQRLKAKPVIKAKEIICKDFFGRIITKPVKPKWGDKGHSSDIWFQYKEGYNNAVKRKVTLKNLL